MYLTEDQSRKLVRAHGIFVREVCDKCSRALGPVRWTRPNETGVWCSKVCRDGERQEYGKCRGCGTRLAGKRRDSVYCSRTCRMRSVRKQIRDAGNIVNTSIEKTELIQPKLSSGCVDSQRRILSHESAQNRLKRTD